MDAEGVFFTPPKLWNEVPVGANKLFQNYNLRNEQNRLTETIFSHRHQISRISEAIGPKPFSFFVFGGQRKTWSCCYLTKLPAPPPLPHQGVCPVSFKRSGWSNNFFLGSANLHDFQSEL